MSKADSERKEGADEWMLCLAKCSPLQTKSRSKASAISLSLAKSFLTACSVLEMFMFMIWLVLIGRTFKTSLLFQIKMLQVSPS